ncbi:Similar to Mitotic spindle assembly checkpoint protein MAD2A; acc. no. Q13257 [Pyronema omphalodes CBS 100304]|uniref:Similar to Mitotic spindle assembly checkpoint protein MAD2A acc. no. Q13257 n=1 Tax=Pyronema omphalodes (strain CBS 100304) TaxID=1076935 RepID=U4KXY4_PYROM|nr:Similar to Mitotic spindle assembly checkpoint protein MAD2A; acc. no. Q13257 [Pyronema omphalodes CBS 100304]
MSTKPRTKTSSSSREKSEKGEKGDKGAGEHKLSLKGSAKRVTEFFEYSINTILYQRGVYPAEEFTTVKKYGLNMLVTIDDNVKDYIKKIMGQLGRWMLHGKISKLVIVISSKDDGEVVERWVFDVQVLGGGNKDKAGATGAAGAAGGTVEKDENGKVLAVGKDAPGKEPFKTEKEIQQEIAGLFRQITATVTFLPMLEGNCTFNVLVYADGDAEVPMEWGDSDAREIQNGEKVTLRSWGTSSHKVDTLVSYRLSE